MFSSFREIFLSNVRLDTNSKVSFDSSSFCLFQNASYLSANQHSLGFERRSSVVSASRSWKFLYCFYGMKIFPQHEKGFLHVLFLTFSYSRKPRRLSRAKASERKRSTFLYRHHDKKYAFLLNVINRTVNM